MHRAEEGRPSLARWLAAVLAVAIGVGCSTGGQSGSGAGGSSAAGRGGTTGGAGAAGSSGSAGSGGTSGSAGSGSAGTSGTTGSAGTGGAGTAGVTGASGSSGGRGAAGTTGAAGASGTTGSAGAGGTATGSAGSGGGGGGGRGGGAAGQSGGGAGGSAGGGAGGSAGGGAGGGAGGSAGGGAGGSAGSGPSGTPTVLSEDGGWCWFQSPRALLYGTRMIVGTLAAGFSNAAIKGNVRALVYDFGTAQTTIIELHNQLELDDHDAPAFLIRPDGRFLTLYGKHDSENHFYYRISQAADGLSWGAEQTFVPSASTSLTYSNVYLLPAESNRIYDFYRGLDGSFKPSYATSDDSGQSWKSGNVVINFTSGTTLQRPYVRYTSNGTDTVHFIYTEAHPRDYDTSLYHIYYKGGSLYGSDGTRLAALTAGITATQGTRIFQADSQHVAWGSDVVLDPQQRPVVTYSVQVGSAGLPVGQGGDDIRYRYARWDGTAWRDDPLAYAGSRLYSGEDDYSGLATLDPGDVSVVYLSANADPKTGVPLVSASDGLRHYEIFRGVTADQGATWSFTPITHDSTVDNLRPLLPAGGDGHQKALLWLRGKYLAYTNYQQQVVALFWRQ